MMKFTGIFIWEASDKYRWVTEAGTPHNAAYDQQQNKIYISSPRQSV